MKNAILARSLNLVVLGFVSGTAGLSLAAAYSGVLSLLQGTAGTGAGLLLLAGALSAASYPIGRRRTDLEDA